MLPENPQLSRRPRKAHSSTQQDTKRSAICIARGANGVAGWKREERKRKARQQRHTRRSVKD